MIKQFFNKLAELNHALAKTYLNKIEINSKERKAKISAYSDKTKNMLQNRLMAFCRKNQ